MKTFLTKLIKFYQIINPFKGTCRYTPTCSEYMLQAVKKHGTIKGIFLGFRRVLKCNSWFKGGYDPVR